MEKKVTFDSRCLNKNQFYQNSSICKFNIEKSCTLKKSRDFELEKELSSIVSTQNCPNFPKENSNILQKNHVQFSPYGCIQFLCKENSVKFLPQPEDNVYNEADSLQPMNSIGPWATGKVDLTKEGKLIGLRPVVDRYSVTRFSEAQWRKKNFEVLEKPLSIYQMNEKNENYINDLVTDSLANVQNQQFESTKSLQEREIEITKRENLLRKAIEDMIDEISILDQEKVRLKKSLVVLKLPQEIANECLDRRSARPEPELVRDAFEDEVIKELAQIAEIRRELNETLDKIEDQLLENKMAKERLDYDWSNKNGAIEIEQKNITLNSTMPTNLLFKNGATRTSRQQCSLDYWSCYTKEILELCEDTRKKSVTLRESFTNILTNAVNKMRLQADIVEAVLKDRIKILEDAANCMEDERTKILETLVQTENRMEKIRAAIEEIIPMLKLAQTRLDNRKLRVHYENTSDIPHEKLIEEVKNLQDKLQTLQSNYITIENVKNELIVTRGNLEREIFLKRQSLLVDRDRLLVLRSHYPSKDELLGHAQA